MDNPLDQPLDGPWALPGRVAGAFRPEPGEPAGVPEPVRQALQALPAVMLERAVERGATTGREALGGPEQVLGPLLAGLPRPWVVLTHGGPRCADVQRDRPVAAAEVRDPLSGRTPRALEGAEWHALHGAFLGAAREALEAGAWALGLEAARGHLWHAAVSPLLSGDVALAQRGADRLVQLVQDLAGLTPRLSVSLAVEDLACLGMHPRAGVALAGRLVDAGVSLVVPRTGSPAFPPRLRPPEPRRPAEEAPALHAARWLRRALAGRARVALAGAVRTQAVAQAAVATGACDVVILGRPLRLGRGLRDALET